MPFTLRYHTCGVTSLLHWNDEQDVPTLISGDEKGSILVWNLLSRKPYYKYTCRGQIVSFQQLNDLIIATSKDHTLRILKFPSTLTTKEGFPDYSLPELELIYEIPVNTLNFANTAVEQVDTNNYRLWCCNTQDSETIDIYEFDLRDSKSLKRIHRALSLYEVISGLVDPSTMKFDKLGTTMKFIIYEGIIYLGFESGFVIGLRLTQGLHIVYISSANYPEPVLDLTVGKDLGKVISSSTNSSLGLHTPNINTESHNNVSSKDVVVDDSTIHSEMVNIPINKVSHIQQVDNLLIAASWSGRTVVFDINGNKVLASILKERGQVLIDDNPYGNASLPENSTKVKISAMTCIPKFNTVNPSCTSEGTRRRWIRFYKETWCLIGYADGSIKATEVTFDNLITA
ncbi:Asa1p [Kluyveromyces lactis]|uniref:ASTRA-associated protein 1 n=1 Tax=Kluyveromyces lactis (strain ATCC 8585 / CBS 2359 / DSM 70799 / NBRC 1267 / NRRL Y-1140 / WM37) TaxID=284590 RepID=ASA1_KLULA|nr:uncharacterized protein KLLA0_D09086g [Kluyveromyces lactis]Q6CRH2.1 RecName: Full=ASTRA-associated protein 1 [Kluyveromyces lactis NRRL Y-1140]CAH00563.1 KLLA0D09086p [Kluyveromyces lactis]|eukprot:XP_453467.1 uncharacterized protein KLLA0_D09086g [Kluyveromyces lactis]